MHLVVNTIEISLECAHPQKMFPHLKLIYFIIFWLWAPLLVLTQSKETFSWCFYYNKSKLLSILFIVKYEKNHTFWSVFGVVGAHNLHVQMRKKIKALKHVRSSLISMANTSGHLTWRAKENLPLKLNDSLFIDIFNSM